MYVCVMPRRSKLLRGGHVKGDGKESKKKKLIPYSHYF